MFGTKEQLAEIKRVVDEVWHCEFSNPDEFVDAVHEALPKGFFRLGEALGVAQQFLLALVSYKWTKDMKARDGDGVPEIRREFREQIH